MTLKWLWAQGGGKGSPAFWGCGHQRAAGGLGEVQLVVVVGGGGEAQVLEGF